MSDWETISRLSREALSRDTDDRSAFLDAACAGDPDLRRQIDGLIGQPAPDTSDLLAALRQMWEESNSPAGQKESPRTRRSHRRAHLRHSVPVPAWDSQRQLPRRPVGGDALSRIRTRRIPHPPGRSRRVPVAHTQRKRFRPRAEHAGRSASGWKIRTWRYRRRNQPGDRRTPDSRCHRRDACPITGAVGVRFPCIGRSTSRSSSAVVRGRDRAAWTLQVPMG